MLGPLHFFQNEHNYLNSQWHAVKIYFLDLHSKLHIKQLHFWRNSDLNGKLNSYNPDHFQHVFPRQYNRTIN